MEILYDSRWIANNGIGRFAEELRKLLPALVPLRITRQPWHPLDPPLLGAYLWRKQPSLFFSPGYNSPIGWPHPFIFTLHDLHHLRVAENSSSLKRAYYEHIIRPACHRAALVLTVSEYSRNEIREWAKIEEDKVINVSNGVGPPFCSTGARYSPGYPYVMHVGSHKPHKNFARLLKAFAISGIQKEVRLVFTGIPDAKVIAWAEEAGLALDQNVQFVQATTNEELARLYRGAEGLVFPSLYEGFGLPPIEAMACGVPVMTSKVCSLPEVVGNAAILVDPMDIESISDGIRRLVLEADLRTQLQRAGLLRARAFSWIETANKTMAALESAVVD